MDNRVAIFEKELNWITVPSLRRFAEHLLGCFPEYFFHRPASSSGKHHPASDLKEDGLIRHTKNVMHIFRMISSCDADQWYAWTDMNSTLLERNIFNSECLVALLVHDSMKYGEGEGVEHTVHEHPLLASQMVLLEGSKFAVADLNPESVKRIANMVATHSGKWSLSKFSSVMLPTPETYQEKLVHLSDYLASRKQLTVELENISEN